MESVILREFRIRLVQDKDTLGSQSTLIIDGVNHQSEFSHIYQGHLEGQFLTVKESVFSYIFTLTETPTIERYRWSPASSLFF